MKQAMKKIMGLLLVAVLLVSVVPFQALAAEGDYNVHVVVMDENKDVLAEDDYPETAGQNSTVEAYLNDMAKNHDGINPDDFVRATVTYANNYPIELDGEIKQNAKLYIVMKAAAEDPEPEDPKPAAEDYNVHVVVKDENDKVLGEDDYPEKAGQNSTVGAYLNDMAKNHDGINPKDFVRATITYANNYPIGLDDEVKQNAKLYIVVKAAEDPKPEDPKPTEPTAAAIKVIVKVGSSDNVVKEFEKVPANGKTAKVGDLLTYGWNKDWNDVYEFDHAWNHTQQKEVTKTQSVNAGDTLYIMLKTSSSNDSGSGSSSNKFPYKVYLHVYVNNNIGEPDRNINITNTLATDGVVSLSEVKNLIPDYYKAKNSNGIGYDGLYLAKGNWVKDYVTDSNKYQKLNDVDVRTGEEYVHINVMITNATARTSSTADTSNPKTGDAIFMTITVMGLSAAALTGLYFYNKKRVVK